MEKKMENGYQCLKRLIKEEKQEMNRLESELFLHSLSLAVLQRKVREELLKPNA